MRINNDAPKSFEAVMLVYGIPQQNGIILTEQAAVQCLQQLGEQIKKRVQRLPGYIITDARMEGNSISGKVYATFERVKTIPQFTAPEREPKPEPTIDAPYSMALQYWYQAKPAVDAYQKAHPFTEGLMDGFFFKSGAHRERFVLTMRQLGRIYDGKFDQEYAAAIYVITAEVATQEKARPYIDNEGIRFEELLAEVDFSGGYTVLLKWAWNLFNAGTHIDPVELMRLDDNNFQVALTALQLRRFGMRDI